jgi:hypothetical protein
MGICDIRESSLGHSTSVSSKVKQLSALSLNNILSTFSGVGYTMIVFISGPNIYIKNIPTAKLIKKTGKET